MKGLKTVYVCSECGHRSSQWSGQCPSCRAWNKLTEDVISEEPIKNPKHPSAKYKNEPVLFDDYEIPEYFRSETGMSELDRVLGGGIVSGSVVLLSGDAAAFFAFSVPGTLLTVLVKGIACGGLAGTKLGGSMSGYALGADAKKFLIELEASHR